MIDKLTNLTWPSRGPDFNKWYIDLPLFARLLDAASELGWWTQDTRFKYINIRVDTRNPCAFLVFAAHGKEQEDNKPVSPDDVLHLIMRSMVRYDIHKAPIFAASITLPELITRIESTAVQYNKSKNSLLKKQDSIETVPLLAGTMVDVGGCVGKITVVTDTTVTVSGVYTYAAEEGIPAFSESWEFTYSVAEFKQLDKYRFDLRSVKIWDASALARAIDTETVK